METRKGQAPLVLASETEAYDHTFLFCPLPQPASSFCPRGMGS